MPANLKRKRKRTSDVHKTPAKKARRSASHTPKTPKKGEKTEKHGKKPVVRKRKRFHRKHGRRKVQKHYRHKKLRQLREKLARTLERALVDVPKMPIIYHLFTETDSMGTPRAPLRDVLRALKISDYLKNTHLLHDTHMKSLTKFTTMFAIEQDEPNRGLFLKYWPIYDKEAATVYVDNLPEGCGEERLMRLANIYGTVAELAISKKTPRWIRPRHHPPKKKPNPNPNHPVHHHIHRVPRKKKPLINIGSRPRQYGFIRFVDVDSAKNMVHDFIVNDPSLPYRKFEAEREQNRLSIDEDDLFIPGDPENLEDPVVPQEFPRRRPFYEHYMSKLLTEIRFLKRRRKRRPFPMYIRLKRLRRKMRELRIREFNCLRRAGLLHPKKVKKDLPPPAQPPDPNQPSTSAASAPLPPPPIPQDAFVKLSNMLRKCNWKNVTKPTQPVPAPSPEEPEKKGRVRKRHNNKRRKKFGNKKKPKPRPEEDGVVKKKKRKRKKMSRRLAKYIPGGQVRKYFQQVQVLSMRSYLELKEEYLQLVEKEREHAREEAEEPPAPDFEM